MQGSMCPSIGGLAHTGKSRGAGGVRTSMRDSCGRAWPVTAVAIASVVALALTPSGALASAKSQRIADSVPGIPGLPTGVPPAAETPEPSLPEPSSSEWPFPSDFSHTSGTGLLSSGASLWTDFVYDDHGPLGSPVGIADNVKVSALAEVHGGFEYPERPAD